MEHGTLSDLAGLRALPGEAGRVLRQWPAQRPLTGVEGSAGGSQGQVLLVAPAGKQGGPVHCIVRISYVTNGTAVFFPPLVKRWCYFVFCVLHSLL